MAEPRDAAHEKARFRHLQLAVAVLTVGGTVAAWLFIPEVRDATSAAFDGDTAQLRADLKAAGWTGLLLLVGLVLAHAVLPYPHEVLSAAAGFVYGFAVAAPIMALSWTACAILSYWVAESLGRPALVRLAGAQRITRLQGIVERGGFAGLILGRIIPLVPFNLFCYVCGVVRVPLWRYTWTSFVGFTPFTLLLVYLGATIGEEGLSLELLWALAALIVVAFAGTLALRRKLRTSPDG